MVSAEMHLLISTNNPLRIGLRGGCFSLRGVFETCGGGAEATINCCGGGVFETDGGGAPEAAVGRGEGMVRRSLVNWDAFDVRFDVRLFFYARAARVPGCLQESPLPSSCM